MRIAVVIFALLFSDVAPASAEEIFDILQIDNQKCNLVVAGTQNKNVKYRGEKRFGHCHIIVNINEFNEKYSSCSLSGVISSTGKVLCDFGYYDANHSMVSFSSGPGAVCLFMCVRK